MKNSLTNTIWTKQDGKIYTRIATKFWIEPAYANTVKPMYEIVRDLVKDPIERVLTANE